MVKKKNNYAWLWISLIIAGAIIIGAIILSPNNNSSNSGLPLQATSDNIYVEVESGGDFIEITHNCFWSGTELRCSGNLKDTETEPHTTDDIYVGVIAFDNNKKCGYCNDKINLGEFSEGKTKTYSLSCDVGKKTDILASIAVTGGGLRFYNSCE